MSGTGTIDTIAAWHRYMADASPALLDELLADDVVFRSPAVHTPQAGKAIAAKYLLAAAQVLGTPAFRYAREWRAERSAILEFHTEVDGLQGQGIDLIAGGEDGRIVEFTVMVRPLKALNAVIGRMAAALGAAPGRTQGKPI